MTSPSLTSPTKDLLSTSSNLYRAKDYVISLRQKLTIQGQDYSFSLRYVPDKLMLDQSGVASYLDQILSEQEQAPESLAHHILENIMDQIIPKWIEINLCQHKNEYDQRIIITLEDRQPHWDAPPLLNRLPKLD